MKKGRLEIICGSMFSGKTEELMRRLRRAEYAKQNVVTINHIIDNRKGNECIASHDGRKRLAFSIEGAACSIEKILDLADGNIDVVGIDELNFFPKEIISVICKLVEKGKRVICSGLDLDFRGEPFEVVSTCLSFSDSVLKLKAICVVCGNDAHHTQRIVNGKPADYGAPIIFVGAEECYEARCRDCFEINKPEDNSLCSVPNLKEDSVEDLL